MADLFPQGPNVQRDRHVRRRDGGGWFHPLVGKAGHRRRYQRRSDAPLRPRRRAVLRINHMHVPGRVVMKTAMKTWNRRQVLQGVGAASAAALWMPPSADAL